MKRFQSLFAILIIIILFATDASCSSSVPKLIMYSWGQNRTPTEAVKHRAYIDTLPLDGMMLNDYAGRNLMSADLNFAGRIGRPGIQDGVWTYEQCMSSFSPFSKTKPNSYYFQNMTHNFGKVNWKVNAGLFSDTDWSWVVESFRNYAKACKDIGLAGIVIDDEINSDTTPGYWSYYDENYANPNPLYYAGRTLKECHMQSRLRGKQVMEAIISEFPNAAVLLFHGPYRSSWVSNAAANSSKAPNPPSLVNHCLGMYCVDWVLDGAFVSGIIEASALQTTTPHSLAVDGGEFYSTHDLPVFKDNYEWRKYGIIDPAIGTTVYPTHPVNFLDASLRSVWSKNISVCYGLFASQRDYDTVTRKFGEWYHSTDMNFVRNTLANALHVADDYVWQDTEWFDWFCDPDPATQSTGDLPPAPPEWIEAFRLARLDAAIDTVAPSIAITSPTINPTYSSIYGTVNLSGTATDNYYVKSVDWSITGGGTGNCTLGANGTWSVNDVPLMPGLNHVAVTVTDRIGNATTDSIDITNNELSVTINQSASQLDPTNGSSVVFDVVFSKPISGFLSNDIILSGTAGATAAVLSSSVDFMNYSVTVSGMTQSGTVIASIPALAVWDKTNTSNKNVASTSTDNIVDYDITSPSVTINQDVAQLDPATTSPILFKAVFSEPVTGFTSSDIVLSGTAQASSVVITDSGDHKNYSVSVSGFTQTGTVVATIPAGSAQDLVGNLSAASSSTDNTITYNGIVPPTVTINQDASQLDPATTSPIVFKVVFSKPISGFLSNDIILSGSAGATTAVLTSSGDYMNYSVAVSGMTQSGTVIASIPALAAWDKVNSANKSVASTSTDNVVVYSDSVTVSGSIDLQSFYADKSGVSGTVDIRDSASGEVVESHPITLDASGNYSFTTSRTGDYTLAAKCSHWLSDAKNVSIALSGNVVNFSLINGDCSNDNAVDEGDFGLLSNAWYSSAGDPNFDVRADLNSDGAIDEGDFGILSNAWYQSGE